jgi:predicted aspartyl protease
LSSSSQRIFAANGTEIEVLVEVVLSLMLNGRQVGTPALVLPDVEKIVLGVDWLKSYAFVWDFGQSRI